MSVAGLGTPHNVKKRIARFMARIVLSSILILLAYVQWNHIIENNAYGVQAILFPIHCLLIFVMKLATYIVFIAKTEKISELIEYLELVVNKRRFPGENNLFPKWICSNWILISNQAAMCLVCPTRFTRNVIRVRRKSWWWLLSLAFAWWYSLTYHRPYAGYRQLCSVHHHLDIGLCRLVLMKRELSMSTRLSRDITANSYPWWKKDTVRCAYSRPVRLGIACRMYCAGTFHVDISGMYDLLRGHLYVLFTMHRGLGSDHCLRKRSNWTTYID